MQPTAIAWSAAFGAMGGAVGAVIVRGIFPVRHKTIIDWLIMLQGAMVAYEATTKGLDDTTGNSVGSLAGSTLAMSYIVGGTPLTSRIGMA